MKTVPRGWLARAIEGGRPDWLRAGDPGNV